MPMNDRIFCFDEGDASRKRVAGSQAGWSGPGGGEVGGGDPDDDCTIAGICRRSRRGF